MDGQLKPWRDAKIHVINQGLHYAGCVFDGARAYNGKIFKLSDHSARLRKSAELIGFEVPYSTAQLDDAANSVIKANNLSDAYVRHFAWRGSKMMGINAKGNFIHTAVAAWYWPSYFSDEIKTRGLRLKTAKWKRPSPETAPSASKASGLYMICTMSKHDAEESGFEDAMMLDYRGYVAEATAANMFFIFDGEIHTPTPDCFLDGITRRTVMKLAADMGNKVVERHIHPDEIHKASECFLTGTAAEITPVGQIDNIHYQVGNTTHSLMDAFSKLVRS
jgi:branched-chain amino acid aminotransferase